MMPLSTPKPLHQELVVTLYGLYGSGPGGSLRVAALVAMLADLGINEQATRSTVSRLKSKGVLRICEEDGSARYALSRDVLDLFHQEDRRIFAPERSKPEDPWSLVIFSVPESERKRRYEVRAELASLGFGFVGPGIAVAPCTSLPQAITRLTERGFEGYIEAFSGHYMWGGDVRERVAQWWDLESLDQQYGQFLEAYGPLVPEWEGLVSSGREFSAAERKQAFHTYVPLLTQWRKFPYRDPNLPLEFLPKGWKAPHAKQIFLALHALLRDPAAAHADELLHFSGR